MTKNVTVTLTVAGLICAANLYALQQIPPPTGHSLGSVSGGDFKMANTVIQKKCISCHSRKVIDQAIAAGKNMQKIQERMEQKGARLNANDKAVLGVFWQQTPLRKGK